MSHRSEYLFQSLAAFLLCLAVILGAFGAHAFKDILPPGDFLTYQVAVQYQFLHSLGLLVVAHMSLTKPEMKLKFVMWGLALGIFIFCGSLYLIVATQTKAWGAVAPIGGSLWIFSWALLGFKFFKKSNA